MTAYSNFSIEVLLLYASIGTAFGIKWIHLLYNKLFRYTKIDEVSCFGDVIKFEPPSLLANVRTCVQDPIFKHGKASSICLPFLEHISENPEQPQTHGHVDQDFEHSEA